MAIDTAAKRRSAAGAGFFLLGPGVTPDATPDAFWRQSAAWSYGGIPAGSAAPAPSARARMISMGTRTMRSDMRVGMRRLPLGALS